MTKSGIHTPKSAKIQALPGWERLSVLARKRHIPYSTLYAWTRRKLLPQKKIGSGCFLSVEAVMTLAEGWPCPSCRRESTGPADLAEHLGFVHRYLPLAAWDLKTKNTDEGARWTCPAPGCPRREAPFPGCMELKKHLAVHVHERRKRKIGERLHQGRGGKMAALIRCKWSGCGKLFMTGKGASRGMCARHYQRARRAKLFTPHHLRDDQR